MNTQTSMETLQSTIDFIDEIYSLKTLIRYNTTPRLQNESVAEHLSFTALIVLQLRQHFSFNLEHALLMALTHDIPEIYTSDVPHPIKKSFPALQKALEEVERHAWSNYPEAWMIANLEMEAGKTLESLIVQLADVLSCVQYTAHEMQLGNTYMTPIKQGSESRVVVLLEKIKTEYPHAYNNI